MNFKKNKPRNFKTHHKDAKPILGSKKTQSVDSRFRAGLYYDQKYLTDKSRLEILNYLGSLFPIWEQRYSMSNPPPEGQANRWLLRPVYWLGNWQFACLDYYHPPKGIFNRCIEAEPFPFCLQKVIHDAETIVHEKFLEKDIPRGWHLNTCLINFYGHHVKEDGKIIDAARVGEHKDFEPGPVASLSIGERALIQFISSQGPRSQSKVVTEQWLDDGSLQIFGGDRYKKQLFHRIQRVDKKLGFQFELPHKNFYTRRINFTFRYVPDEHIVPFQKLPSEKQNDVRGYMQELAQHSIFFKQQIEDKG